MEENKTKMFLEVDTSQVEIKKLLRKDFLELSMKAISSANPNRNNSWFTKESMEKSLDSFRNKPILGYFENGDFVSHNGDWEYDPETDIDYWNTLGKQGERILGIIRESDDIKIIQDKNGLYWITLTCALWTQYSFKQVKRLIKDAKRAQQTGETAKNISVEIDVLDFEELKNGVKKINAFNLVGITILGSRNGVKVQPGIEDAGLSVTDIMGKEVYSTQEKALRLAYAQLDNPVEKKEESQMEKEENKKSETSENLSTGEETHKDDLSKEGEVGACTKCGKSPCECEKEHEEGDEPKKEENAQKNMEDHPEEDKHGDVNGDHDGDDDDDDHDDDNDKDEDDDDHDDDGHGVDKKDGALVKECENNFSYTSASAKAAVVTVPMDTSTTFSPVSIGIAPLDPGLTILYNAETDPKFIELKAKYEAVLKEKEALSKELEEVKVKVQTYEHEKFLEKAYALIKSAKLSEETTLQFNKACEDNSITNLDDLKTKIGLALFELRSAETVGETEENKEEHNLSFNAPVNKPNTDSVFEKKEEKKAQKDIWEKIREYNSK